MGTDMNSHVLGPEHSNGAMAAGQDEASGDASILAACQTLYGQLLDRLIAPRGSGGAVDGLNAADFMLSAAVVVLSEDGAQQPLLSAELAQQV